MKNQILLELPEVQSLMAGGVISFNIAGQQIEVRAETDSLGKLPRRRCSYCKSWKHITQNCRKYQAARARRAKRRQGLAALSPQRRAKIASMGGYARAAAMRKKQPRRGRP